MKRSANMQTTQVECVTFVQNLFSTVCTWKGTYADGSSRFVCWHCNKYFCSSNLLMGHHEKDHAGPESREILNKVLVDRRNGVKGSFPDDVFPCEKCGESFSGKEIMMTHLSSHNVKANTRTSWQCNKYFCSSNFLRGHQEKEHAGPESRKIWKKSEV